jgi:hypothetical protein
MNMAQHVKCSVKDFFSTQWPGSSWFYNDTFSKKRFLQLYWDLHVSSLLEVELLIAKCTPELLSYKYN